MPTETGIFTPEEAATGHLFSYRLAQFIGSISIPKSELVIDIGCGPGSYLRYLMDIGYEKVIGFEGTSDQKFEIPELLVVKTDLTQPLPQQVKGNVICLEVGEHIPNEFTNVFLNNIASSVKDNGWLIMSWAIPGQEGTGHVNCQINEWVIFQMNERGLTFCRKSTEHARQLVEPHLAYFKESILIFKKK